MQGPLGQWEQRGQEPRQTSVREVIWGGGGGRGPSASICRDRGREEMVKIGEREEIKLKALKQRREQANDPHKEAEKHV